MRLILALLFLLVTNHVLAQSSNAVLQQYDHDKSSQGPDYANRQLANTVGQLNSNNTFVSSVNRAPTPNDDTAHGHLTTDLWLNPLDGQVYNMADGTAGLASWVKMIVPVTPGDAGGTPLVSYGVCRVVGAYVGNLFTVTRTSDSTTQAAPQSTNGCADPAPLDTFCANTVCFISTLNDQSGNAFDCVGTAANGPQWMPNIVINGQRAIRFPSVPHTIGSLTTVAKLCTAEGVTSWSTSSYSIVFAGRVSLSAGPASLFTDSPASAGFSTAGNNHVAAIFGSGGIAPQLAIPVTPITLGFTTIGGVGGAKLWVGNDFAVANTVALGTKTGLILGTASTQYQRMDLLSFTLYATPLTDAQMLNVRTSVAGQWKIPPQCCDFIVSVHGDSLNTGDGSVTQVGYPNRAIELQNTPVKMYNFSTFGNNLVGNGGILALATTDMNLIWRSNARLMLEIIEGGANDIRAGILTSTLIDGIRAWNPTFKLNRPNLKVMYATTPLQSNTLANLGWLDQAHSFNDIIARNFNILINSGGLGGDFLMNLWANPLVGQGNYTTSAFNSLTCSLDGGHMTDLCQGQLSGTAAGAIMGALQ